MRTRVNIEDDMPILLQTQTAPSNPSAADVAAQVRAQVQQQIQAANADALKEANRALKAAQKAQHEAPIVPGAPLAPIAPGMPLPITIEPDTPFDIPPRVENLGYGLFLMIAVIAIGKPLARAIGSVIERRALRSTPQDLGPRLERIEQGIEAVSIEIERISESQRYLLKMKSPAEPVGIPRSGS